jgi:hypothetical protein
MTNFIDTSNITHILRHKPHNSSLLLLISLTLPLPLIYSNNSWDAIYRIQERQLPKITYLLVAKVKLPKITYLLVAKVKHMKMISQQKQLLLISSLQLIPNTCKLNTQMQNALKKSLSKC